MFIILGIASVIHKKRNAEELKLLKIKLLESLKASELSFLDADKIIQVNDENHYNALLDIQYFLQDDDELYIAYLRLKEKTEYLNRLNDILENDEFKSSRMYMTFINSMESYRNSLSTYNVRICYGNKSDNICIKEYNIKKQFVDRLNKMALNTLGLEKWLYNEYDFVVELKSARGVDEYTVEKFFKSNKGILDEVKNRIEEKRSYYNKLSNFLCDNDLKNIPFYEELEHKIKGDMSKLNCYRIYIKYRSATGRSFNDNILDIDDNLIKELEEDPSILMTKGEYSAYMKELNKKELDDKKRVYCDKINEIIDSVNKYKGNFIIYDDENTVEDLIMVLYDKVALKIDKVKSVDDNIWAFFDDIIEDVNNKVSAIIDKNEKIISYYNSDDFRRIKNTCSSLIAAKRDFNEYIDEKAKSISELFGVRVIRNETVNNDTYSYIRPYKKSITPFTAEVSAAVFASAENSPMDYIVKYFYNDKSKYEEQINKLRILIGELETLSEAKQIIENYKKEYEQYITDVPVFIMDNDRDGFFVRLGFADIGENILNVEYKFVYTSNGGMAQRYFTVHMNEENIIELINRLQDKLTMTSFAKEQRALMTSKLRQHIKERDHYTCRYCGNSIYKEPNLLLEVDHIKPIVKGGYTVEENLQTLCWKCNRSKAGK